MKKLYLLGITLLCLADLDAQVRKIVAIGSSTVGGTGAWPRDSAFVRRLSFLYKDHLGAVDSVYQYGVGGYNCYKGMPTGYVPPPGRQSYGPDPNNNITRAIAVLNDLPDPSNGVVIVNYPSNEFHIFSIAEIMFCLQTIYNAAVAEGHKCYITTTQPRTNGVYGTSDNKRKFAVIKDSIINRFGEANVLNFWDGMYNPADTTIKTEYADGDDIHFNNAGHRVLFQRVVAKDVFNLGPLPVTVKDFNAAIKTASVELKWTAHHENDPDAYFMVQRSGNGILFESLKKLHITHDGNGKNSYQFTDHQPLSGTAYYRLEVHERARTYHSSTISVKRPGNDLLISRLYPTRVVETLTLEIISAQSQTATLEIIGSNGTRLKLFNRNLNRDKNIINLPVAGLAQGSYFVRISTPGKTPLIQTFVK